MKKVNNKRPAMTAPGAQGRLRYFMGRAISNIRQKLGALPGNAMTIETVRSVGYRIR